MTSEFKKVKSAYDLNRLKEEKIIEAKATLQHHIYYCKEYERRIANFREAIDTYNEKIEEAKNIARQEVDAEINEILKERWVSWDEWSKMTKKQKYFHKLNTLQQTSLKTRCEMVIKRLNCMIKAYNITFPSYMEIMEDYNELNYEKYNNAVSFYFRIVDSISKGMPHVENNEVSDYALNLIRDLGFCVTLHKVKIIGSHESDYDSIGDCDHDECHQTTCEHEITTIIISV